MEGISGMVVNCRGTSIRPGDFPGTIAITPQRVVSCSSYSEGQPLGRAPDQYFFKG